jgi:hypothetical protein
MASKNKCLAQIKKSTERAAATVGAVLLRRKMTKEGITTMTKFLTSTAVLLALAANANAGTFRSAIQEENAWRAYECVVVKVTPPDRDRDPGYKVNINIYDGEFESVFHTTVSGKTYDRTEQYVDLKTGKNGATYWWSGWSRKYQHIKMTGTVTRERGQVIYTEFVQRGNKLETVIRTVCHKDSDERD